MAEIAQEDHRPFASLLPHGPVVGDPSDGILLLQEPKYPKGAGLGCVWKVTPRNVGAISDAAVEQMAMVLQGLFRSLVPGTAIQVIMHMAPTDRVERWSDFRKDAPDVYSLNEFQEANMKEGMAHADGAKRWRLRDTTTLMTARLSAPIPDLGRRQRGLSLFRSEQKLLRHLNRVTETVLARVAEELEELRMLCESVLDMAGVGHERLDCAGIQREVARLLQPWQREARCYDDELPMREQVLSVPARTTQQGAWVFGPDETVTEGEREWEARVMSLQQAPPRTYPGMLSSLHAPRDTEPFAPWESLPDTPLTLVTQVGVPDQEDERSMLRQKRNFAYIQRNNLFGEEDPEKRQLRQDLDAMMRDTTSHILHTRVHLVLWGKAGRSMASTFSVITQAGRRVGLEFMPEAIIGNQLFLQCLPLGLNLKYPREQMLRRSRRIPAISAAHLLPLYGDYTGSATPAQLYTNARGEAVCVDFFDRPLPHTIVAGMSRSGKSFLVNHLIQQVLPLGASVCILDRWASYDTTTEVYKGEYVAIELDKPICFNPFAGDLQQEHRTFLVALIDQMASGVTGRDAGGFGQEQKAVCDTALQAFAEWQAENRPGEEPVLRDFYNLLRDPPFEDEGIGRGIALRLAQYVGKGAYAGFVDGRNELDMSNNLTVFELAGLDKAKDLQSVLLLCLMYRLMKYITNPAARQQRKYLILDEAWALLKQESAAAFLEEAARALARFRCCAMFMTQQVSDFDSPAAQAVKNNSSNYVLLQQNPEQIGIIREVFDLTEQEVRLLSKVHVRPTWGEAFLWQPDGSGGIIRLVPDPFLRWLASQKPHERGAREKLKAELGGDLMGAVSQLARDYPLGMPQLAA
ncbi:MAG: ATP-binding protein [bacterium]|nr:ATP-binding protein [bacterium]